MVVDGFIYTFFVEVLPFVARPSHRGRYLIYLYIEAEFLGELCTYKKKILDINLSFVMARFSFILALTSFRV
jgi:hypothetical protein